MKARRCSAGFVILLPLLVSLALSGCVQINLSTAESPALQRRHVKAASLARILGSVSPIKIMIVEYYNTRGEYPSSLRDLGLERAAMSTAQYIDDLELDREGNILIRASKSLGEHVYVNLDHQVVMGGLQVAWKCTTNIEEAALVSIPTCSYDKDVRRLE